LGFIKSNKGKYREHIKELMRKGILATRKVWGLGERIRTTLIEGGFYLSI